MAVAWLLLASGGCALGARHTGSQDTRLLADTFRSPTRAAAARPVRPHRIASGTGWVSASGYVVTCEHVVEGKDEVTLVRPDKRRIPARVVARDRANDIAILAADGGADASTVLPPGLALAPGAPARGAAVLTVGYPLPAVFAETATVSRGRIDALTGIDGDPRIYRLAMTVQGGNSGGPLLATSGEVVGMVAAKLVPTAAARRAGVPSPRVSYAVRATAIQSLLDSLPPSRAPARTIAPGAHDPDELAALARAATLRVVARPLKPPTDAVPALRIEGADERHAQRVLEFNRSGEPGRWRNTATGYEFTLIPARTYRRSSAATTQYCRDYEATVAAGHMRVQAAAAACRRSGGYWDTRG